MNNTAPKCQYSNEPAEYQIGVAKHNKRTAEQMVGFVSEQHVKGAINNIMSQAFGTNLWPTVHDLNGNLLYHSYDADQQGIAAAAGWEMKKKELQKEQSA